jgi:hypothetical protein
MEESRPSLKLNLVNTRKYNVSHRKQINIITDDKITAISDTFCLSNTSVFPLVVVYEITDDSQYSNWLWDGKLDNRGMIPSGSWEFFSLTPRSDWFWGPPRLLSNRYQGLFPWG